MKSSIVLLHGWGLSKKTFEPLLHELSTRGHDVFCLDFPGFGEEPAPSTPWNVTSYATFLHEYIKKHNILKPILIGHSFGGRVSLRYTSLYNKTVRALILTGTPGFSPVRSKKRLLFMLLAKVAKPFFALPLLSAVMEDIRGRYYAIAGANEYTKAQGTMRETFKQVVEDSLVDDMKHVAVPCLLLWGENDTMVPVSIAKRMQQVIPMSTLVVIPDQGHAVPYKHPNRFADEVERFIKQI